jgi:hypothetical protein
MLRRSFVVTLAGSLIGGCAKVTPAPVEIPADAPPPSKIRRLLVWLPAPSATETARPGLTTSKSLFDNEVFVSELRQKLQPFGVEIAVGTSSGSERDRRDEQNALVARFRPTHRLEVDVARVVVARDYSRMGGDVTGAFMKWSLFDTQAGRLVRSKPFGATGDPAVTRAHVDSAVEYLAAQGFL